MSEVTARLHRLPEAVWEVDYRSLQGRPGRTTPDDDGVIRRAGLRQLERQFAEAAD
jgi:hypothetical protein